MLPKWRFGKPPVLMPATVKTDRYEFAQPHRQIILPGADLRR